MKKKLIILLVVILIVLFVGGGLYYYFLFLKKQPPALFYYMEQNSKTKPVSQQGVNLPEKLVIEPGIYTIEEKYYDLQKEGLYQFKKDDKVINRIVYKSDPWAILSGLAWIESPDAKTKIKTKADLKNAQNIALTSTIGLSCGNISSISDAVLMGENIESRSVMGLSMGYDWKDNEDNGHTILEVKLDRWTAVDVDNNAYFVADGKNLTWWEVFNKVKNNEQYEIKWLAKDSANKTEQELREYYKKMFGVPFISNSKFFFFTAEGAEKEKAQKYSKTYKFADKADWFERFYPGYGYR